MDGQVGWRLDSAFTGGLHIVLDRPGNGVGFVVARTPHLFDKQRRAIAVMAMRKPANSCS
jgi:hypothetical protein